MDKYLRPARFDCDPNTVGVDKQWKHWLKASENFLVAKNSHTLDKLVTLTNYMSRVGSVNVTNKGTLQIGDVTHGG